MRIPLLPWQWTQCPQMWIRRTVRQVTSSFMMAAFTSHRAASSGSCWSNLCCFGYDIDPTHWKERVSEAERERERERASERRCIRWTCGQTEWAPGGFVKDLPGEEASLLSQVLFRIRFLYFTYAISVHPSVCPYVYLPGGSSCSKSATPVRRNFVKFHIWEFPTIFWCFADRASQYNLSN